jgi:hypothetical protein
MRRRAHSFLEKQVCLLKNVSTKRYIDDVLSFNNSKKCDGDVDPIYSIELEIKDTTDGMFHTCTYCNN